MTISAIVPAAGCGARAALNGNKILAPLLYEKSVLFWTLQALCPVVYASSELVELIVVARAEEFEAIERVWKQCAFSLPFQLVEGGATRQDSVFEGVKKAKGELVLIHDAARPCVSSIQVVGTVAAASGTGAAVVGIKATDTVKTIKDGYVENTLERGNIMLAQTPQVFRRDWFLKALEKARKEGFVGTDCSSLMEHAGYRVAWVSGTDTNLKVTFAHDLERAATILAKQLQNRAAANIFNSKL